MLSASFGDFLTETWMPQKRRVVRATTAYRYAWFIDRYIQPAVGDIALRRLRPDHFDSLSEHLGTHGGRHGNGLASKTVSEVHMICRAALDDAVARQLVVRNVAHHTKRRKPEIRQVSKSWTLDELTKFLTAAASQRLYPALHLAAHTGMRRGELVGLKWGDLDSARRRLSVVRTV